MEGTFEALSKPAARRFVHISDEPVAQLHARVDGQLAKILDVALELTRADMGNIQLLDDVGRLRIRVQRGVSNRAGLGR